MRVPHRARYQATLKTLGVTTVTVVTMKYSLYLKRPIDPPSRSSYDVIHEGLSRRHLDPVLAATTENGPRDGI